MANRHVALSPKPGKHLATKKIFLSWGGEDALHIAKWLKTEVFDHLPYFGEAFLSENIEYGEEFANRIHEELSIATNAVGIMTDVALDRPWFLYEISFLKSRLGSVPLLQFAAELGPGHPLKSIQYGKGFEFSSIQSLAEDLLKDCDAKVRDAFVGSLAAKSSAWDAFTRPMRERMDGTRDLRDAVTAAIDVIREYKMRGNAASHSCMKAIACKTLDDLAISFRGLTKQGQRTYKIDYRQYPEYLMHLQKSLNATTHAIAIVDDMEEFWAHKTGADILANTTPQSQRIFVFENSDLFARYFRQILLHAEKYMVFVMSTVEFDRVRHRVTRDFSIIEDGQTKDRVAAFYDDAAATIQFSNDRLVVEQKLSVFADVLRWAHRVMPPRRQADWDSYQKQLSEIIFRHRPQLGQHSSVIPIELYDAFEEDHPYYREMHDEMLREFRSRADNPDAAFAVLEIGAGTGLFTKRLAQQSYPNMKIKAMEPDANAHPLLLRKLQRKANRVQPIQASILTYDPKGEFRFVFSSFSEHHIRPEDKAQYFSVVMDTMEAGGFLIVGDEFLPPHACDDPAAYEKALEEYHNFIIEKARASHLYEVAELERLALESGRPEASERIDFKVSLDWYKQKAAAAGLVQVAEHCISPSHLAATTGGIYVLVYRKS